MRQTKSQIYKPRIIDRIMFGVLSLICVTNGMYVIGPWYLEVRPDGDEAPLQNIFSNEHVVKVYGVLLLLVAVGLIFSAVTKHTVKGYTSIISTSLILGFLFRLYSLISVVLALESWRPPSYISHAATVVIFGAYWVWVRVNVRPPE